MDFKIENGILSYADKDIVNAIVPEGVTRLESNAFCCCKKLESIILPDSLKDFGDYVFKDCISLKFVKLPPKTKNIHGCMFWGCKSLEQVEIPDSVRSIGAYAFSRCESLKSIKFSKGIESFETSAFFACKNLERIETAEDNPYFRSIDGVLFDKNQTELIYVPVNKTAAEYRIPDGVRTIKNRAFCGCENLSDIILPDSLEKIGREAFIDCFNLKKIIIPKSVKKIGHCAFSRHTTLVFQCNNMNFPLYLYDDWGDKEKNLPVFFKNPVFENFTGIDNYKYRNFFALLRFFGYGEQQYKDYIKSEIIDIFRYITDMDIYDLIEPVLALGFADKNNIDDIIAYAIEKHKTEIYVILLDYKNKYIGFENDNFEI